MNTYAVLMQTHAMSALGQWMVIGLTLTCFACALVLSGQQTPTKALTRLGWGVLAALVLAVLASQPLYAYIYIPCTDPAGISWYWWLVWGC